MANFFAMISLNHWARRHGVPTRTAYNRFARGTLRYPRSGQPVSARRDPVSGSITVDEAPEDLLDEVDPRELARRVDPVELVRRLDPHELARLLVEAGYDLRRTATEDHGA